MTPVFTLTIDVEEDNQWQQEPAATLANIQNLFKLQALCEKYGILPTYLVTYGTVEDKSSRKILQDLLVNSSCEIGAHLHPWSTPPYTATFCYGAFPPTYPSELPEELLHDKLAILTKSITQYLEIAPLSYRAGRFGLDIRSIDILLELGYIVDTSVTPLYNWGTRPGTIEGGPDFTSASFNPYFLGYTDICRGNTLDVSKLLEVPVTIRPGTGPEPHWLRPFPGTTGEKLVALCYQEIAQACPVMNMMFHSSELLPGGSPYASTEEDVHDLFGKIEAVFAFLQQAHIPSMTLSQFAFQWTT